MGLGGMSLALPYLASWRGDDGWGVRTMPLARGDGLRPQRVVFWTNALGTLHQYWTPKNTSADGKVWELNDIMAPLAPYKDKTTVLTGVNYANIFRKIGRNGSHNEGGVSVLCGGDWNLTYPFGPNTAMYTPATESIDHAIASRLGANSRFESLFVGESNGHQSFSSINAQGAWRLPVKQSDQLYDLLFKDFEGSKADIERRRLSRKASLDATLAGYKHLSSRVSAADKRILDAHLEGLMALDARLSSTTSCAPPPTRPAPHWDPTNPDTYNIAAGEGPYKELSDLLVRALACQMTNVAVMSISGDMASAYHPAVVPNFDSYKAGLAESDRNGGSNQHGLSHSMWSYTAGTAMYKDICTWRSSLLAGFLKGLSETIDIDGRPMIDNTCVVVTNELFTGLHDLIADQKWAYSDPANANAIPAGSKPKGLPIALIGGLGDKLKTGLHLDLSAGNTYGDALGKYSVNELFMTIARAMGIDASKMPTIGDPETCKNVISEILV